MKRHIQSLALVTTLALGTALPGVASATMEQELNMLTGAVYNQLTSIQMDAADIANLTLAEINQISQIMSGGDSEGEKRSKISSILQKAASR